MGEIVNLNRVRKDLKRQEKKAKAAENRVIFGRSRAETERLDAERDLAGRRLDGHHRDSPETDAPERGDEGPHGDGR